MKIKLLRNFLATCCTIFVFFNQAHGVDDNQTPQSHLPLRIKFFKLSLPPFDEVKKFYLSQNQHEKKEKKFCRYIMKMIVKDNENENQIEALRVLISSNIEKDSSFSRNYIFNAILSPNIYHEEKIIELYQVLLEGSPSDRMVGARHLIKYPDHRYKSAHILYGNSMYNFPKDRQKALKVFRLVAGDQTEEFDKRFEAANLLYPLWGFGGVINSARDDNENTALRVYREVTNKPITNKEQLTRLYNVSELLLAQSQHEDVNLALNNFEKIAGMYQTYIYEACSASDKLALNDFLKYGETIFQVYKYKFINIIDDEIKNDSYSINTLDLFFNSENQTYREFAFNTYFNILTNMLRNNVNTPLLYHVLSLLVNKGSSYFINVNGNQQRVDVYALDSICFKIQHFNSPSYPRPIRQQIHDEYGKALFDHGNPRPNDQVFTEHYNKAYSFFKSLGLPFN